MMLLKIFLFLEIHMPQAAKIIISMDEGYFSLLLISSVAQRLGAAYFSTDKIYL
jgi:hypothetical protein